MLAYRFNELPFLNENGFVFDLARSDPGLDLIAKPLQLFNLLLEVLFIFLFLIAVGGMVNFIPRLVKLVYSFGDFFKAAVDFRCKIQNSE